MTAVRASPHRPSSETTESSVPLISASPLGRREETVKPLCPTRSWSTSRPDAGPPSGCRRSGWSTSSGKPDDQWSSTRAARLESPKRLFRPH